MPEEDEIRLRSDGNTDYTIEVDTHGSLSIGGQREEWVCPDCGEEYASTWSKPDAGGIHLNEDDHNGFCIACLHDKLAEVGIPELERISE